MERSWKAELRTYSPFEMSILETNVINLKASLFYEVAKDLSRMQKMERLHKERMKAMQNALSDKDRDYRDFQENDGCVQVKSEEVINTVLAYGDRTVTLCINGNDFTAPFDSDYDRVAKLLVVICHDPKTRRRLRTYEIADAIGLKFHEFEALIDMLCSTENCDLADLNTLHGASDIKSYFTSVVVHGAIVGWDLLDPFPFIGDLIKAQKESEEQNAQQQPDEEDSE
ncbi:unnamed protein product [Auanema sp. JU1783]|nr:unnamed protein product [Auanema sp. JU1783]